MTSSVKIDVAHPAKTPNAAAGAGIAFSILFAAGVVLIRLSANELSGAATLSETTRGRLNIAMALMPFAGIAFLWFVGVVRHHLGIYEDQFFATVTLGSGLLFVGMSFVAFALAGGLLAAYQSGVAPAAGMYSLNMAVLSQAFNTYALKMAGVFMTSLGALWRKTGVMPRVLTLVTYALALVMLVSLSHNLWLALIFPAWVLIVSIYILFAGLGHRPDDIDGLPARAVG
jgi:hypothetical protein